MQQEGYCQCGCGSKTTLAVKTNAARGLVKGRPVRFLPGHGRNPLGVRIGERYGDLLVVAEAGHAPRSRRLVACRCECGEETIVRVDMIRSGHTSSCGCGSRETRRVKTHGMTESPEYLSWKGMIQRCTNPKHTSYEYYGARGITICQRWRDSFEAFLVDMGSRPEGKTLDRIDNDGNYEPGNCRWATASEQNSNQRPRRRRH